MQRNEQIRKVLERAFQREKVLSEERIFFICRSKERTLRILQSMLKAGLVRRHIYSNRGLLYSRKASNAPQFVLGEEKLAETILSTVCLPGVWVKYDKIRQATRPCLAKDLHQVLDKLEDFGVLQRTSEGKFTYEWLGSKSSEA